MSWKRRWNQLKNLANIDTIQFNTAFSDGNAEGRLQWNTEDGTLEYGLPGGVVNLQVGQEHVVRCRNESGGDIGDGVVVYVSGESGNKPLIAKADADPTSSIPQSVVLGMTTEPIDDNMNGYVTLMGLVRDINTDGIASGTMVWLSTTPGEFVDAPPASPNRHIAVGQVIISSATIGSIYVRVNVVPPLLLLSDVLFGDPNDGDILVWVEANSRFELQQPT